MTYVCPACQAENPVGVRFCRACGRAAISAIQEVTPQVMQPGSACASCGTANVLIAQFCKNCGVPLLAVRQTPVKAPTPPPPPPLPPPSPPRPSAPAPVRADALALPPSRTPSWSGRKVSLALVFVVGLVGTGLGGWLAWDRRDTPVAQEAPPASGSSEALAGSAGAPAVGPAPFGGAVGAPAATAAESLESAGQEAAAHSAAGVDSPSNLGTSTGATQASEAELFAAQKQRQNQQKLERERRERERLVALKQQRAAEEQRQAEEDPVNDARIQRQAAEASQAQQAARVAANTTVDGVCASSSNIIRREICRLQACANNEFSTTRSAFGFGRQKRKTGLNGRTIDPPVSAGDFQIPFI